MPRYDESLVRPLREELTRLGVRELRSAAEVDAAVAQSGTLLLVVNSVCGCAGAAARPGVALALAHRVRPDHLVTVFAGQDEEATARAREHLKPYPPSSPAIAVLRDGKLAVMLERRNIEGRPPQDVARQLTEAFDRVCAPATGPR